MFVMKRQIMVTGLLLGAMALAALSGCAKKTVPVQSGMPAVSETGPKAASGLSHGIDEAKWRKLGLLTDEERLKFLDKAESFENDDVYFEFDSYVLLEEARQVLDRKVEFLRRFPKVTVTIEGHCDERGTSEYNLALGERRANSVWQYFVNSGVDPSRLSMISYGEERPIALSHDEASWARNRRAHCVLHY